MLFNIEMDSSKFHITGLKGELKKIEKVAETDAVPVVEDSSSTLKLTPSAEKELHLTKLINKHSNLSPEEITLVIDIVDGVRNSID